MDTPQHWYAVYTKPRNEKKLVSRLCEKGIEAYTPLRKTLKQWSDRKKFVDEPLIHSYVFVHVTSDHYYDVLNTPGAVRYIWFSGKPAAIPEKQIQTLKLITGTGIDVECLPGNIPEGSQVKVISGPLHGLTGELVNYAGKQKVVIRIDHINQAVTFTVPIHLLEILGGDKRTAKNE